MLKTFTSRQAVNKATHLARCFSSEDFQIKFNKSASMHDSIQDLERLESELLRKQKSNFLMNLPLDVDGTHILPKLPKREK